MAVQSGPPQDKGIGLVSLVHELLKLCALSTHVGGHLAPDLLDTRTSAGLVGHHREVAGFDFAVHGR